MKNIALTLSYCGTNYHGWQVQPYHITVQETLEKAIEKRTGAYSYLSGCGRTDSGVHAKTYCANFKSDTSIPLDRLHMALNSVLPYDIVIRDARIVSADFDARFDCVAKEYTYTFYNDRLPDPFEQFRSFHVIKALDTQAMTLAAQHFVGKQDFAAVRNEGTPVKSTVREIHYCDVIPDGKKLHIRVCADGFLYNMVRNIAGCLWYVGDGKLTPQEVRNMLDSKNRSAGGPTVPPHGLYMTNVFYSQKEFDLWMKR